MSWSLLAPDTPRRSHGCAVPISPSARKNAKAQGGEWSSGQWGDTPRHPTISPPKGSAQTPSDDEATLSPAFQLNTWALPRAEDGARCFRCCSSGPLRGSSERSGGVLKVALLLPRIRPLQDKGWEWGLPRGRCPWPQRAVTSEPGPLLGGWLVSNDG